MNCICTTTIRAPSAALLRYAEMPGWQLIVAGDDKTPHKAFRDIDCIYLNPEQQHDEFPLLSSLIGRNTSARRNFALIEAYRRGATVVATVDDDNIPYDDWGQDLLAGNKCRLSLFTGNRPVLDPLQIPTARCACGPIARCWPDASRPQPAAPALANADQVAGRIWHRGFPLEWVHVSTVEYKCEVNVLVDVQADLWDGDPDIDAVLRLACTCQGVEFDPFKPFTTDKLVPFNSQNTFISRRVLPYYMMIPGVGRVEDIWGAYIMQVMLRRMGQPPAIAFNNASVRQDRNEHDVIVDLENELYGYKHTGDLVSGKLCDVLPPCAIRAYREYRRIMHSVQREDKP